MKKTIIFILVLTGIISQLFAEIPERPVPPRLVNDFASVLSENEYNQMESHLEKFARETSTQIVVVTLGDLEGYDPADFAQRLGEKWGVGQKGKDNGLVVLLKPKTNDSRGQIYISTGYGLEAVLPDIIVNREIVENEMIPRFKENDYYGGLAAGINVMMEITRGEYTAEHYKQSVNSGGGGFSIFGILLFIAIISIFGRGRRRRFYSPGRSLPFWLAMGMMSGGSRGSSGSFGNFSSGSGSFGGFGGFGGGSFGGGGAG
ncbi:MAG: TPM domain-containing protein, partial [Draconibacterium sp.]|nr:TPM domain-containing protein [Draconibacterium sp.]